MLYLKKFLILFIFSVLIILSLSPLIQARPYLLTTNSSLTISSDNSDFGIILPNSGTVTRNITVRYEYGNLARPKGFPFPNSKSPTSIELAVMDEPSWCEVEIEDQDFEADIGNVLQKKSIIFNTTVSAEITSETIAAFSEGTIVINTTAMKNGNIVGSYATYEFTISPDFIPKITYFLSNSSFSLKAGEQTNLSLFMKNDGNSKIKVEVESNNTMGDLIQISLPSDVEIEAGKNKSLIIKLSALPKENTTKENVSVCLNLTYYSTEAPSNKKITMCVPVAFEITITDEEFIDLTYYVLGIFAAFLIIFIIISVIVWVRRRE